MVERRYNQKNNGEAVAVISGRTRFWELDFLRGLCVILMVIFHFFWAVSYILSQVQAWIGAEFWTGLQTFAELFLVNNFISIAHYVVISLFLILCGISCTLTRNNALRGFKTLGLAILITMVTWLADSFLIPNILILFGVIHALACSMLLFSLVDLAGRGLQKLAKRGKAKTVMLYVRRLLPAAIGIAGLIIFFTIPLAHFGKASSTVTVDGNRVVFYSTFLYSDVLPTDSRGLNNFLSMLINVKNYRFRSSDHFPIFPYAFMLLIGGTIGQLVYKTRAKNALAVLDGRWNKPICFVGRHAMLTYLLHQLVIVAFLFAAGGIYSLFI